jgi:hypothetical protein
MRSMQSRLRSLVVLSGAVLLVAGCGGAKPASTPATTSATTVASATSTATTRTGPAPGGSHLSAADAGALDARLIAINRAIARRDRAGALRELAAFAALVRTDAHRGKLTPASQQALSTGIARTRQQIDDELPAPPRGQNPGSGPAGPTGANSGFGH